MAASHSVIERPRPELAVRVRPASTVRDLAPAAALLVVGLLGLLVASLTGSGRGGQYLVVAGPWSSPVQTINIVHAAHGGIVGVGGLQNIVIAASPRADFAQRARRAGAWLVLPSPRIAGCFSARPEPSSR